MTDPEDAGPSRSDSDDGGRTGQGPPSADARSLAAALTAPAWIALGVAVVALVLSVVVWYQVAVSARLEVGRELQKIENVSQGFSALRESQGDLRRRIDEIEQRIDSGQTELVDRVQGLRDELDERLAREEQVRKEAIAAMQADFDALRGSVNEVYQDLGRTVDTWLLEEVEQLLMLAHQRLALDGDAELATTALQIADDKLAEIGAPDLIEVRRSIADKLTELNAVERADIAGIALALDAMTGQVADWPLAEDAGGPDWQAELESAGSAAEDGGPWWAAGRELLDDLMRLVRIRRVDESRVPKLDPTLRFLVVEHTRLLLFGAQMAVLRDQGDVYQAELQRASSWIERYFDLESRAVAGAMGSLANLRQANVAPRLPDIAEPLEALRAVMEQRSAGADRGRTQ